MAGREAVIVSHIRRAPAKFVIVSVALALCSQLLSCGGASSPTVTPPPTAEAQGYYEGRLSIGGSIYLLVLPNDQIYGMYGIASQPNYVTDVITGSVQESDFNYTASVCDSYQAETCGDETITGSLVAGTSFNGAINALPYPHPFTAAPPSASIYDYNVRAQLSQLSGAYPGFVMGEAGQTSTSIDPSGALSASSDFGCAISGTFTPSASGKNFFDVTLTFGELCGPAGQTLTGAGIVKLSTDGKSKVLFSAVSNSTNTANTILIGSTPPPSASRGENSIARVP